MITGPWMLRQYALDPRHGAPAIQLQLGASVREHASTAPGVSKARITPRCLAMGPVQGKVAIHICGKLEVQAAPWGIQAGAR